MIFETKIVFFKSISYIKEMINENSLTFGDNWFMINCINNNDLTWINGNTSQISIINKK